MTAQDFEKLDKSPMDAVITRNQDNSLLVRITYSRPQKKGHKIFGNSVPFGKLWRTGANEATEITLYEDILINGEKINSGTYTLYSILNEQNWEIIINKATNTWGAYNYDESLDVLRTTVPVKRTSASIENFSIHFKPTDMGTDLLIGWDNTFVEIPIQKAK